MYKAKLLDLYDEQFELNYWVEYVEGERDATGGSEPSFEDGLEPTCSMELVEPAREEAQVLSVPIGEGTSEVAVPVVTSQIIP